MSPTKVVIAGFSGKLARLITQELLRSQDDVLVYGLCRNPDKVVPAIKSSPRVKVFAADSQDVPTIRQALEGADVCICCYLGDDNLMIQGQKLLIDACIEENVARYIASDWSIDIRALTQGEHPAKDPMKEVAAYLDKAESQSKIKTIHILNGAFAEVVVAPFLGWIDAASDVFRYFGSGDEPIEMTVMEDAAAFTAAVALDQNATGYIKVLGDRKSVKEMAKIYKSVYSTSPQVECQGSFDDLHVRMTKVFQKEPANLFAWMGMYYQYYMGTGKTNLGELDNSRYSNIKPKTFEQFLQTQQKESVGMSYMTI